LTWTLRLLPAVSLCLALLLPAGIGAVTTDDPDFSCAAPATRAVVNSSYSVYSDSDGYHTISSSSAFAARLGRSRLLAQYDDALAFGPQVGTQRLWDGLVGMYTDLTETTKVGGSIGLASEQKGGATPIGSLMTETELLGTDLTLVVTRDTLSSTALVISKGIRMTDFYIFGSRPLLLGMLGGFTVHHKRFSDQNSANEAMGSISRRFAVLGVSMTLGARFNYQDYARPTEAGYFAPQDRIAPEGFWGVAFTRGALTASMELSLARSFYRQVVMRGESTAENFGSPGFDANGSLDVSYALAKNMKAEFSLEGSDSGFNTAAPWKYFQTSVRINYAF